jgi:hypothetical protein
VCCVAVGTDRGEADGTIGVSEVVRGGDGDGAGGDGGGVDGIDVVDFKGYVWWSVSGWFCTLGVCWLTLHSITMSLLVLVDLPE